MTLAQALQIFELQNLENQDDKTLKKIYYRLAQKYHPDRGGTFEQFVALQEAHLFLKKSLGKRQYGQNENYETGDNYQDSSDDSFDLNKAYNDLKSRFGTLHKHFEDLIQVVDKYENIFNTQINIINQSNSRTKSLVDKYHELKNNLKLTLDQELQIVKRQYNRTWWEYILPTKKLSQNEYITHSNMYVEKFNSSNQALDDEFVTQMLKLYQTSFQDLVDLLSEV